LKVYESKGYNIYNGTEALDFLFQYLIEKDYSTVFVLTDSNTQKHCLPQLSPYLIDFKHISIDAGENAKNIKNGEKIWTFLADHYADRKTVLINLGGGTITDLGGFCAATYKRGIDFIHVPTTLLGMVDASIGGKQGIDLNYFKNSVGVFKHPVAIFIYPGFLKTLPKRQLTAGVAEMMKHALISDKDEWDKFTKMNVHDEEKIVLLISKSVKIKREIVNKDPQEKNIRKVLNFGHTIGHAIESYSLKHDSNPLLHGEAIAIGIICETWLSYKLLQVSKKEAEEVVEFVTGYFPVYPLAKVNQNELLDLMRNDKKNEDDLINFSLLKKIGKPIINQTTSDALIREALNFYIQLQPNDTATQAPSTN
jgi:3-dehydroquinate synthase